MSRERERFLIVRLRLHPDGSGSEVKLRQRPVSPRGANYENSLLETAIANMLPVRRPGFSGHHAESNSRQAEGPWRGSGLRNFVRRDIRIQEDVSDRLTDASEIDASGIEVSVNHGEVLLQGLVETKWARRRAEDLADSVSGVTLVQNDLRIQAPGRSYTSGVGGPNGRDV